MIKIDDVYAALAKKYPLAIITITAIESVDRGWVTAGHLVRYVKREKNDEPTNGSLHLCYFSRLSSKKNETEWDNYL